MTTFSFNGMDCKAVATNNNNINNNYKFYRMSGGHDFADLAGAVEEMRYINSAIGVRGHEGIRIFVRRDEGMWTLTMFNLVAMGRASHEEKYNLGHRMTANMVKRIEDLVLAFIDTIADYEQGMYEAMQEAMQECVDRYQTEIDGYVEDLERISDNYDGIKTKVDAFAVMCVLKKIKQVCDDCLVAVGEISGCDMVWDDGYHVDLSEVAKWYGNYCPMDDKYAYYDIENDIVAIDCLIGADSGMPLADDETLGYIESSIVDRGELDLDWMFGYDYPLYLVDDIREYVETAYHYAYCA